MTAVQTDELFAHVAALWCERLGVAEVAADDNFLDLGGHSLLAIQITAALREQINDDIPLILLFDHLVLADYVDALREFAA